MARKEHLSVREEEEKAEKLKEKKARGETLTREEAGFLGAVASRQATSREGEKAQREGRQEEFEEEHRTKSWMAGEETHKPVVTGGTRKEIERIREKQARGETLTRHESGVLGGAERARRVEE